MGGNYLHAATWQSISNKLFHGKGGGGNGRVGRESQKANNDFVYVRSIMCVCVSVHGLVCLLQQYMRSTKWLRGKKALAKVNIGSCVVAVVALI